MTLRKKDIQILNDLAAQKQHGQSLSTDDFVLYQSILKHSASWESDFDKSEKESYESIIHKVKTENLRVEKSNEYHYLKVAASLALFVVSVFLMYKFIDTNSVNAEVAEIKTIYLPDSSKIILNAASSITYSKSNWNNGNRTLELDGQAYFEVKKGSQFQVKSNQGTVSVLGTSFNIYDRKGNYKVECFTGKVSVELPNKTAKVYLTKGLKTKRQNLDSEKLETPVAFDKIKSKEWTNGIFNFYNTPLTDVFSELERQFDINVTYKVVDTKFYTGTFSRNDLAKAIINICKPMGYSYKIKENTVLIINN
jgi:transmembrane sensor